MEATWPYDCMLPGGKAVKNVGQVKNAGFDKRGVQPGSGGLQGGKWCRRLLHSHFGCWSLLNLYNFNCGSFLMCILTCLLVVTSVFWGLIIDEWDSHFDLLVTSVLLSWAGGRLSLLLRHLSCESKVFSQNLCAKKICWTLTSKSEAEVGGVNTVAAPEVEGAWARPGHALIKLLEFQKQHSHINTTSYISHFQYNCICQRPLSH